MWDWAYAIGRFFRGLVDPASKPPEIRRESVSDVDRRTDRLKREHFAAKRRARHKPAEAESEDIYEDDPVDGAADDTRKLEAVVPSGGKPVDSLDGLVVEERVISEPPARPTDGARGRTRLEDGSSPTDSQGSDGT